MQKLQYVVLFPGQGSQKVGMGLSIFDCPAGRAVFDEADQVLRPLLGEDLSQVIFQGPQDKLQDTRYAQPALMTVSMALWRTLLAQGFSAESVRWMAGHSLGEWTALCAAGVLSLQETARLLYVRGLAMGKAANQASKKGDIGMMAVMGLAPEAFFQKEFQAFNTPKAVCVVANDNGAGQVVLSGHKSALEDAKVWATAQRARCIFLPVSGAFHSPLMTSAQTELQDALSAVRFNVPAVPIVTNISATPQTKPETLKDHAVCQVTGRVRFRETLDLLTSEKSAALEKGSAEPQNKCPSENASEACVTVLEVGAGRVLTQLAKRHCPDLNVRSVQTIEDIKTLFHQKAENSGTD